MSTSLKEILVKDIVDYYKNFFNRYVPLKIFTIDKKILNINNKSQRTEIKKYLILTN